MVVSQPLTPDALRILTEDTSPYMKRFILTLAPLHPQYLGEPTQEFCFLPPVLEGRGGECKAVDVLDLGGYRKAPYWARAADKMVLI